MASIKYLIKQIHKRVTDVKQSKEMEVEYVTLLQRDRENLELEREEGAKIIKLYLKGMTSKDIASSLGLDLNSVKDVITEYKNA